MCQKSVLSEWGKKKKKKKTRQASLMALPGSSNDTPLHLLLPGTLSSLPRLRPLFRPTGPGQHVSAVPPLTSVSTPPNPNLTSAPLKYPPNPSTFHHHALPPPPPTGRPLQVAGPPCRLLLSWQSHLTIPLLPGTALLWESRFCPTPFLSRTQSL